MKKMRIEAVGKEEQLNQLATLLRTIQHLGGVGATRTLKLWIDGDGAARMKFDFPNIDNKEKITFLHVDNEDKKTEQEKPWTIYID